MNRLAWWCLDTAAVALVLWVVFFWSGCTFKVKLQAPTDPVELEHTVNVRLDGGIGVEHTVVLSQLPDGGL